MPGMQPDKDGSFQRAWLDYGGSPARVAKGLGITVRAVYFTRARLAEHGIYLPTVPLQQTSTGGNGGSWQVPLQPYKPRHTDTVKDLYDATGAYDFQHAES